MKRIQLYLICFGLISTLVNAQAVISTQPHEGSVNYLLPTETSALQDSYFYSAGSDGFLVKWSSDGMGEHYQVSTMQINLIAQNQARGEIAFYETDGVSVHRVIVIDERTYRRKYSKRFANTITSISYSSRGKYLFVGTTAAIGTFILDAATGDVLKKIPDISGIVTYAKTGSSDNTAIMYSQSGILYYYDMDRLRIKTSFASVNNLDNTLLFGTDKFKNRFFAGTKNNLIYIVDATSGKTLCQIPANSPLIFASDFTSEEKQGLYYIADRGRSYSLYQIDFPSLENILRGSSSSVSPILIKSFTGLANRDHFTFASKNSSTIMLGTQSGNIYTMPDLTESELYTLFPTTQNMYQKIFDIQSDDSFFYILTQNALFSTSYDSKTMTRICSNDGQTNISKSGNLIIFWSEEKQSPVQVYNLEAPQSIPQTLFIPDGQIRNLRVVNGKIIYITGSTAISMYDPTTEEISELYSGTSVQDAVLIDDNTLVVAKTITVGGDSPLISVNIQTQEILPLRFTGDVAFSLSYDENSGNNLIYGITLEDVNGSFRTRVFSYNPQNQSQSTLLTLQSDDAEAFTKTSLPYVFTNIGKTQVRSYNTSTRRTTIYIRSASMPQSIASSKNRLAVLNYDGSISWYNISSSSLISNWYLTTDEEWFEF